ncbi:MAG: 4-alpha-glucanotransferase, partial [Gammaproteobacteria bacterium]|nr:4-alpha-glucanotransferase [Gammaproteobacteria bacterium]
MNRLPTFDRRRAGILLHPSSLPGGDLGPDAYRFIDFLAATSTSVWQMLPLGPTHAHGSPYDCQSVHALDPRWLSQARLTQDGWPRVSTDVQRPFDRLRALHAHLLHPKAAATRAHFETYCMHAAGWLEDYALFRTLRDVHAGRPWWEWPPELRDREPRTLDTVHETHGETLMLIRFEQFLLAQQFDALRHYAHTHDIRLFGDVPLFVSHDSADVWAHRAYFKLDALGQPRMVAGVPPDYFSATGQRWGNPLYDWERLQQDKFSWWLARLGTELARFDLLRIDHFRGFEACWEIPAHDQTAINGHWMAVPGVAFFEQLQQRFGALPLVAEDLGIITAEVNALRDRFGLPGMLVMQFAFDGGPENPYLPHNHRRSAVVYTGTHDNNTTLGWYASLTAPQRQHVDAYL